MKQLLHKYKIENLSNYLSPLLQQSTLLLFFIFSLRYSDMYNFYKFTKKERKIVIVIIL